MPVAKSKLVRSDVLPDILGQNLRTVFCGTAVGYSSAERGQYYANGSNSFWKTLFEVDLTDRQLQPEEQYSLIDYGFGLTDLAKTQVGMDVGIQSSDFFTGRLIKLAKVYGPRSVAFNGKKAAEAVLGHKADYGQQDASGILSDISVWVLPSTSGAARRYFDIDVWRKFSIWINQLA